MPRISLLQRAEEPLDVRYRVHALRGDWTGYFECHVQSDWLLIWYTTETRHLVRPHRHPFRSLRVARHARILSHRASDKAEAACFEGPQP
jgi:addiction module RelE/StbE family toxin